jgi:hypothetical protein
MCQQKVQGAAYLKHVKLNIKHIKLNQKNTCINIEIIS